MLPRLPGATVAAIFWAAGFTVFVCVRGQGSNPIREALFLGNESMSNNTIDNCVWKRGLERDPCPDPQIYMNLYTSSDPKTKKQVDDDSNEFLRFSGWDPELETVLIIHGYAGADDTLPIIVLRDAYLNHGSYNVLMLDWGALAEPPCYVAAVHNLRPVARCVAHSLERLRRQGLQPERFTCVGHSLGAHICGILANYVTFRLQRIIGLDPARPLIRSSATVRLDPGDAVAVHVIHTNAGKYGEPGRLGHVDFCINGGRNQPFCKDTPNESLCSHIWAICYQAESVFRSRLAEPCTRRCVGRPTGGSRGGARPLPLGQSTPIGARGTYCVENDQPPFCPTFEDDVGDDRCCLQPKPPSDVEAEGDGSRSFFHPLRLRRRKHVWGY